MCTVLPLRLGIFITAVCTVIWCICMVFFPKFQEEVIIFTGGYCLKSRLALGFVNFTGIFFGLCGALGTWYCRRTYVLTFNLWQLIRIIAFGYVYYVDIPLLNQCEYWVNDVDAMIKKYDWNDLMYKLAMNAVCGQERIRFWIGSVFFFLVYIYITWKTHEYCEQVGRQPKHLLRIPKDLTSGAWYAHSLGEKNHMNEQWGQRNKPTYGAMPFAA